MSTTAIGIDLGGTNLRVALVDGEGRRLAEHFGPVPVAVAAEAILAEVVRQVWRVRGAASPAGVGLGIGAALDAAGRPRAGMSNLPALAGRDLAGELGAALALPVRIDNDARAAMLGEARFGAARDVGNALMLTLGTGIGGGLLLDGRVRAGPHLLAGEIGLSLVPAPAGAADGGTSGWVALEDRASPGGLARTQGIDLAEVSARAAAGDAGAGRQLDEVARLVAVTIVNVHVALDLERALLAGGLMRAGAPFLTAVEDGWRRLCPPALRGHLTIMPAALGEWSGAVGAAGLWLDAG